MLVDKFINKLVINSVNEQLVLSLINKNGLLRTLLAINKKSFNSESCNKIEFTIGNISEIELCDLPNIVYTKLAHEEDSLLIEHLDTCIHNTGATSKISGNLNIGSFETPRYMVERHRLVVDRFIINRHELSDIIKYLGSYIDPVTERELLLSGYIGNLLNSKITTEASYKEDEVKKGDIYALASPEFLGSVQLSDIKIKYNLEQDSLNISENIIISVNENAVAKTVRIDLNKEKYKLEEA